jgi:hypothetical protein
LDFYELHNLFWFTFYEFITVSWLESRVLRVRQVNSGFFLSFFNWIFFFQFHTLTLGVWELKFIISFYFLSMELFWSPNLGFIGWRGLFFYFFYFFIFQFNPSTLGWLRIELYKFFICFLWIITVLWPGSWVKRLNLGFFIGFLVDLFFQLHLSILGWYEIRLHIFFRLRSMRLFQSHNSGHGFGQLTRIVFNILF